MQHSDPSMGKIPRSRSRVLGQLLEKVRPNIQDRERSKSTGQADKPLITQQKAPVPKKSFMSRFAIKHIHFLIQLREIPAEHLRCRQILS